jgi:hypothetical protein
MSWLTGTWVQSPYPISEAKKRGREWQGWFSLAPDPAGQKPGVYRLVALQDAKTPAIIHRVCGDDPTGTLYIGASDNVMFRVSDLIKTHHTNFMSTPQNRGPAPGRESGPHPDTCSIYSLGGPHAGGGHFPRHTAIGATSSLLRPPANPSRAAASEPGKDALQRPSRRYVAFRSRRIASWLRSMYRAVIDRSACPASSCTSLRLPPAAVIPRAQLVIAVRRPLWLEHPSKPSPR